MDIGLEYENDNTEDGALSTEIDDIPNENITLFENEEHINKKLQDSLAGKFECTIYMLIKSYNFNRISIGICKIIK